MSPTYPQTMRLSTSVARKHLSEIITTVQDPRAFCVLTRHDKPVAAIVSMTELERIVESQDMEDVIAGKRRPATFILGRGLRARSNREAAEEIRRVQLDRRMEREVLKLAGMAPIPGGEILEEMGVVVERKKRWWGWGSALRKLSRRARNSEPKV